MINFEPNVAVIDDKFEEVKEIVHHYNKLGVGCKFFNAHLITGDNKPEKTYSDISLVFLDIFFSSNFTDYNPEFCTGWVQALVPPKSFYLLIIWTTDVEKGAEVLSLLKESHHNPIFSLIKGKQDFLKNGVYDYSDLLNQIEKEYEKFSELNELFIWKNNIKKACNKVIGGLAKKSSGDIICQKLQRIIIGHGGTGIREEGPNRKREILFEAFNQILNSNALDLSSCNEIDPKNIEGLYKNFPKKFNEEVDRELNSWFYFKLENETSDNLVYSGLLAKMNHKFLRNIFSLQDDDKLKKKLELQTNGNGVEIVDVVLVMTRACDIAQNKFGKNVKLMSGVLLSNPYRYSSENIGSRKNKDNYIGAIHFNDQELPDSSFLLDNIYINEKDRDVAILLDFRYVFSLPKDVFNRKFSKIKVFNKEIFSEIQVKYSSYSSRLGITQIY